MIKFVGAITTALLVVGLLRSGAVTINTQQSAEVIGNTTDAATAGGLTPQKGQQGFNPSPEGNYILCDESGQNCQRVSRNE